MNSLVRLFVVSLSYFAASLAAGFILSLWLFFSVRYSSGELLNALGARELKDLVASIVVSSESAALLALGPALPAIVYSERKYIQSFWFYAYGGALIGLLSFATYCVVLALPEPAQILFLLLRSFDFSRSGVWLLTTSAGFTGGAVYWLIAHGNADIRPVGASRPN